MIEITYSVASIDDVDGIQGLMYPTYFNESIYNTQEYDHDMTKKTITNWLDNVCVVAKHKDKIIAVASMYYSKTYYKTPQADIEMFYVHPDFRGYGVSRDLVRILVDNADANKCSAIYTSCASGISVKNDKQYQNLFKKFGFNKLGTEMVKINV